MKKNVLKKLVAIVATTAMALAAIAAVPAEAEAATTKTVYVEVKGDNTADQVLINFWNWTGIVSNEHVTTGAFDGWAPGPVALTAADGMYKCTLDIEGTEFVEDGNGLTVYLGSAGDNRIEVDPTWNNTANWAAVKDAIVSADEAMCISIDLAAWTIGLGEVPQPETEAPTTTVAAGTTEETTTAPAAGTTTPNTGDASMVAVLLAVAAVSAVVVLKRRTVNE